MKLTLHLSEETAAALEKYIQNEASSSIEDGALKLLTQVLIAKGLLPAKEEHGLDPAHLNASNDD